MYVIPVVIENLSLYMCRTLHFFSISKGSCFIRNYSAEADVKYESI